MESILWRATADVTRISGPLKESVKADVVVVGCGIMGATTALALAKEGVSVVVLERQRIGEGASSRPGGFVVPTFAVSQPGAVIDTLGETGERLVASTARSADRVFELARQYDIECDASQEGWYQPAHSSKAMEEIRTAARQWESYGLELKLLDAKATTRLTGVDGYKGSWFVRSGGTIHPLKFTLGLAEAARAAGAGIYEQSPVVAVDSHHGGFTVTTDIGATVSADTVVLCCNARAPDLVPQLASSVLPLKIWQAASSPIRLEERRHLFQRGESLSDTRRNLFTYRFDSEWRLITGQLDVAGVGPGKIGDLMMNRLRRQLRLTSKPRLEHLWNGLAAVTRSRLPEVDIGANGRLIAPVACNGRGIALSTVVGEAIAEGIVGGRFDELPASVVTRKPSLGVKLQRLLLPFYPYYAVLRDRMEA